MLEKDQLQKARDLAARQHGIITRDQLKAFGLKKDAIQRRLDGGELVTLHASVYAFAGTPDTFHRRLRAAVFAAGEGAYVSHRAAGFLFGLETEPVVELSLLNARRPRLKGVTVYRVKVLTWKHTTVRADFPVTDVARTLCDLASVLDRETLELTLDRALAQRKVKLRDVKRTLDALPKNSKGAGVLRALIAQRPEGRARKESPLEGALQAFLEGTGFTGWTPQLEAAGRRIDVAFPAAKLALQLDSYRHHSSRTDWATDHRRHRDLVEAGWRVLPVTKEDLEDEAGLAERIRRALGQTTLVPLAAELSAT